MKDFIQYLREQKKWWLVPILLVLLALGVMAVVVSSTVVAPFIYTLF